jgi:prevent-host-death family protein
VATRVVGVRELRSALAALVRAAGSGDRVLVTVSGRPVAALVPAAGAGASAVADLVASGQLELPRRDGTPVLGEPMPVHAPRIDRAVREVRG